MVVPTFPSFRQLGACLLLVLGNMQPAQAAYVERFTPQGEVRDARRATVVFSEPMVRLGDRQAPAPFLVSCPGGGSGQWSDERTWSYQLDKPLGAGERCDFQFRAGLLSLMGEKVGGGAYAFYGAGPWIRESKPRSGESIEEDQVFLLTTAQAVRPESLARAAWCEADGLAERIPLEVLALQERDRILTALQLTGTPELQAVRCVQRLPAGGKARLVWGVGIESLTGVRTRQQAMLEFPVREAFRATLTCERERAEMPCSPLADMFLVFSEVVPRKLAELVRLNTPQGARKPELDVSGEDTLEQLRFRRPFPPLAQLKLELPKGLADVSGRPLENAAAFPLAVSVGALPPLAKFPGRFGILELKEGGVLPVTLRKVETSLPMGVEGVNAAARQLRLDEDALVIATQRALEKFEAKVNSAAGPQGDGYDPYYAREFSFLADRAGVDKRALPKPGSSDEFEVLGIPLSKPGFYVVELESRLLGKALLSTPKPMYVRTSALVTNLAVHFKKSRENALVWVTSLDQGKPVAGARLKISDCRGKSLWTGDTDTQGRALVQQALVSTDCDGEEFFFVSARQGDDFSFARSDWNDGIEPWRFGMSSWSDLEPRRFHAVLDRSLLRAGETLSLKLIARDLGMGGLSYPKPGELPPSLRVQFLGGEDEWHLPLHWDVRGVATLNWPIPASARVGAYQLSVEEGQGSDVIVGQLRVSEFRLPVFTGVLEATGGRQIGVGELPLQMQLRFLNGGAAAGHEVRISGAMGALWLSFPGYDNFNFELPRDFLPGEGSPSETEKLVVDKAPVVLDKQGSGKLLVKLPGRSVVPQLFRGEMTFADPNGAIQTMTGNTEIWPAGVVPGIRVEDWISVREKGRVEVVVLDPRGQPVADAPVKVSARRRVELSHRKRIVGGFYAYEQSVEYEDLGKLCEGRSDGRGRFLCEARTNKPGNVELVVEAKDKQGRSSQSGTSYWVEGAGDLWFAQDNLDRMDLLPEKALYQPGETARFQVRMPFREATVLVAVEREGVLETFVRELSRADPVVEVPIRAEWAPNVYVSVLAVRGRVRDVPWYSFFQWGWKEPVEWFKAWWNPPGATALVDLAKPAFKLGLAEIQVGRAAHELKVEVKTDKAEYQTRETVQVKVRVLQPNGKPVPAGSEVALAAVDQALLELGPNPSWNILDAMILHRGYGVETATAQMQVVGKRHFGKKALPAGGGGGRGATRELFDTLLLWNPKVTLDQEGSATVAVPLNDALTQFTIVAVADVGPGLFGTGRTQVQTRQDLQVISGLPPLVRERDHYQALLTLRNGSGHSMQVGLTAKVGASQADQELSAQQVTIPAGEARELSWEVLVPEGPAQQVWQIEAQEQVAGSGKGGARDSLKIVQQVTPAVPITVQQSSFLQVNGSVALNVAAPQGSVPGQGGVEVGLVPRLSTPSAGLQRYFQEYPYSCLEQKTSRAIGLGQPALWTQVAEQIPAYLDTQGFARYFPGSGPGSDTLTAYLLTVSQAAGLTWPEAVSKKMEEALTAFVEGRVQLASWAPRSDLLERKLAALEALSRRGKANSRQLGSLEVVPSQLSDSALVDWFAILQRLPDGARGQQRLTEAAGEIRNRLRDVGGQLEFTPRAEGVSWWLMSSESTTRFRLLEAVLDDSAWQDDLPRLMRGAMAHQRQGHWGTTVANVWAKLALAGFARRFETVPVSGATRATLDDRPVGQVNWQSDNPGGRFLVPWSTRQRQLAGTPSGKPGGAQAVGASDVLRLTHEGNGSPWASVSVLAAMPVLKAESRGFVVTRTVTPIAQKKAGVYTRGDVLRVRLEVEAAQAMSWVVISDPVPGGATVLGDGGGRDSLLSTVGEKLTGDALPAFEERTLAFYRAYYERVPKGRFVAEYTLRLNSTGTFTLPATRVEAMYGPEWYGVSPNQNLQVLSP